VVVRARLDRVGKVVEATALSGSQYLIPESVANVKKWRFQSNPHRVVVVVYNFRLSHAMCEYPSGFFELEVPNLATVTARNAEP
jgi:hypothetical protein